MIVSEHVLSVLEELPVRPPPDILGVSLYDADIEGLWHRCFNCYSKVRPGVWCDYHIEWCRDWSNDHIEGALALALLNCSYSKARPGGVKPSFLVVDVTIFSGIVSVT